jgi:hypothetical protein
LEAACAKAEKVLECFVHGDRHEGERQILLDDFDRVCFENLPESQYGELALRIREAVLKLDPASQWEAAWLFWTTPYLLVINNPAPGEEGGDERAP